MTQYHDTGRYCGQSHKGCYYTALKVMAFIGPKRERKERDKASTNRDSKQSGNMFVLRRTFEEAKPQRLCEGPSKDHTTLLTFPWKLVIFHDPLNLQSCHRSSRSLHSTMNYYGIFNQFLI